MRKQVFSIMMMLAMVIMASTGAYAQFGTGNTPADPRLTVVGSTSQFTITNSGTFAVDVDWELFDATADFATVTAAVATQCLFVTDFTNATADDPDADAVAATTGTSVAYVKWITEQSNDVYIVRATSTTDVGNTCSTVREFYVSVFDFDVNVYLSNADGSSLTTDAGSPITTCNSWDGSLVANILTNPPADVDPYEGGEISTNHANYVDNQTDDNPKYTDTYFAVELDISSAPASLTIADMKWRLRYSMPDLIAATSIWSIQCISAPNNDLPSFASNSQVWIGDDGATDFTTSFNSISGSVDWSAGTDNEIYFPAITDGTTTDQTALYVFRVRTHNNLGQADMVWNVQVERAELEFQTGTNNYNNGTKVHSSYAGTDESKLDGTDDTSLSTTIWQTPATSVIDIQD